jgi:hypothetical protein
LIDAKTGRPALKCEAWQKAQSLRKRDAGSATIKVGVFPAGRLGGRRLRVEGALQTDGRNRSFGLLLAAVCAALAAAAYFKGGHYLVWAVAALVLTGIALGMARLLDPLRQLWMKFGAMLGRVVNPLILLAVFVVVMAAVGGLMRLFRKDPLARKWDKAMASYWIVRDDKSLDSERLREQG